MWVLFNPFFMFSNFYQLDFHKEMFAWHYQIYNEASTNLLPPKTIGYGYRKCMFADFLIKYIDPPNGVHC